MPLKRKQIFLVALVAVLTLVAWSWWQLSKRVPDLRPHGATLVRMRLTHEEVRHGPSGEGPRISRGFSA